MTGNGLMRSISWRTPGPDKATVRLTLGAVVAVAVFLGLSWNDGHYWDEYFYLYSVFAHSPAELVRFEVQSAIFPVGFFSEKIGHVALLDLLTTVFGAGPKVLYAIQAVYALLLLGFFGAAYGLLRDLLGEQRARDSSLVLMFSPLALYLSPDARAGSALRVEIRSETGPWLASVWLAASALPFLAGHEPRYFAPALVPLAVLAAAGLRGVGGFLFGTRFRHGWVGLLAALALVNRGLLVPLMPYEVDQARLLGLFRTLHARAPGATYLISWTADYSLLRFSFPAARIELCLSNIPAGRHFRPGHEGPITQPDRWWAGATTTSVPARRWCGSHTHGTSSVGHSIRRRSGCSNCSAA